jgi:hypothetical protein
VSEFQYYEFVAIDRPLTGREMRELRAITSRATITPTRLVNTYEWGSFKGDPPTLMERYFDAFLYYANWGTHWLMLRLPRRVLDGKTAKRYCTAGSAAARVTRTHVILEFRSEDERAEWEGEPEGWLGSITPVRAELGAGDLRAIYLAWLLRAQTGELRETALEPLVPDGLGALTGSLTAFADFLRIDRDLIAVAAERSANPPAAPAKRALQRWLRGLSSDEKDALLSDLLAGDEPRLRPELWRRIREESASGGRSGSGVSDGEPRTVECLLREAAERRHRRRTPDG